MAHQEDGKRGTANELGSTSGSFLLLFLFRPPSPFRELAVPR
jgi:hypothetical protein